MAILMALLNPPRNRGRYRGTWLGVLFVVVAGLIAGTTFATAQAPVPGSQVKAAFLLNFPKYVDWPVEAFAKTDQPIVIAVLDGTKVAGELQKIIEGRRVNGRELVLKRLAADEDSHGFHIRFISEREHRRSPNLIVDLKTRGVLTVGESKDFLESGGIINLAYRDGKIALEINLAAAELARIRISSKLLGVASVVKGKSK